VIFMGMSALLIYEVYVRTRKEVRLAEVQDRLEEELETKNRFLSMSALQLRTPLTVIVGYLSLLLEDPEDKYEMNQSARQGLQRSYTSAKNLNDIIDDMAAANEVNTGEFSVQIEDEVDLTKLVNEILENREHFFEEEETEVETEFLGRNFTTLIDKSKFEEALNNVVDNAVHYGDGYVKITVKEGGETHTIAVTDNGIGLSEEDKQGLFDKFTRGTESSKNNPNGSGLGLYLSKTIAEQHGGRIDVESEGRGEGSTFSIIVPQKETE